MTENEDYLQSDKCLDGDAFRLQVDIMRKSVDV